MTESELRARVVELAHAADWRVFSLPIAKTRRPVKDAVGYPDLTMARKGRVLWLELKVDARTLGESQREWLDELPAFAAYVIVPADLTNGKLVRLLA